jgi:streptogramin lyase
VYERCRRLLAAELGAYPSPETESIYRGLLEAPPDRAEGAIARGTPPSEAVPLAGLETVGSRRGRRRKRVALVAALFVAAIVAATLAEVGGGGAAPKVLPNSVVRIDAETMKVKQVVSVPDAPDLVVASGGFVWITTHVLRDIDSGALREAGDRTLTRVDPATGQAVVVGGGLAPCGLTADPSGDVWVANCYPATAGPRDDVVRIDARTLDFKRTWTVPGGEGFLRGLAYGGGSLWVAQIFGGDLPNDNILTQVNPRTGSRRAIRLEHPATSLGWSAGYGDLWIVNFLDGSLTKLHPATGAVETITGAASNPGFAAVVGDDVWVSDWSLPRVVRIRAVGPARPRSVDLPVFVGVWNVAAGAGAVWATTPRAAALWRIDPTTNAISRVRVPHLPTGVTVDGNNVWVTVRKN